VLIGVVLRGFVVDYISEGHVHGDEDHGHLEAGHDERDH